MAIQSAILTAEHFPGDILLMAAKRLEDYRQDRYETVDEFTGNLGISLRTYYKILAGTRPRITTMRRIAEKLGVHPSEITEFARKPSEER